VGILGVIITAILRTFNEDIEYTLTAAEVQKIEESRKKNTPAKAPQDGEDMGLWEFVKTVVSWALGIIRNRRRTDG